MSKSIFTWILFPLLLSSVAGLSQSSKQPVVSTYTYHPPSADKESWQRLNLWLSSSYTYAVLGMVHPDSSLIYASRSLGLSRLLIAAEGIENPHLIGESRWFDRQEPGTGRQQLSQAKGKDRVELMILLGAYYVSGHKRVPQYKDSIEYFLNNAVSESKKSGEKKLNRVARCLLVKLYAVLGDTVNCNTAFSELITECRSAGDRKTEARALMYRGMYTSLTPNTTITQEVVTNFLDRKIGYLNQAEKIYHELKDTEAEIVTLVMAGYLNGALSRWDEAYPIFEKALELQHSIGYPYTHYSTDNLALVTTAQGKFGEPLKYCMETIQTAEAARDSLGWALFYSRLGLLYSTDGQRQEESLKWMSKALRRYVMVKDPNVYQTLYNIVTTMIQVDGKEKEALDLVISTSKAVPPMNSSDSIFHHITFATGYMGVKQYKLAVQYALAADSIVNTAESESYNNSYEKTMIYATLGSVYFAAGQYAQAKKYLELDLNHSSRPVILLNDLETYKQMIFIDSVFNDAPSAVEHYRKYTQLVDSNFRASKIRQAEELQVQYQTREKQDSIALLHQEAKLKQVNLKQATLTKNVTIGGAIAAILIAGLLYRQNRLKQKNNNVITQKNEQLQHYLTEKEWLLKEIHHRVKNNLQIVMSLLNSQSAYIDNEHALTAIHDSRHRVHAMSLIHQKLYGSENVSSIDMSFYIRELVSYLSDSFDTGQRIRFEYDIEPLELDVSQAVPLGLILNEAITNSIKYAFPGGRNGVIAISLSPTAPDHYLLSISDNGIGMPPGFNNKKPGSLGMSLMAGLSEDLDGHFAIENNNGTTINISFVHDLSVKRHDTMAASFVSNN
jgi:two-component sensor histidine kinase